MRHTGLDEAQTGTKIAGRNINKLIYADDTTLMAESEEELKSLLMKVKEKSEKVGLKFRKLRSWHLISSLQCKQLGKQWKQYQTLFFWAPKSLQILTVATKLKDTCAPWKKGYDQPRQCIKKQGHYFANKSPSS